MNDKLLKGVKVYIACDDNPKLVPNNVLGAFKNKNDALRYIGQYVIEFNKFTYTGYLKIVEMSIGEPGKNKIIGWEQDGK